MMFCGCLSVIDSPPLLSC